VLIDGLGRRRRRRLRSCRGLGRCGHMGCDRHRQDDGPRDQDGEAAGSQTGQVGPERHEKARQGAELLLCESQISGGLYYVFQPARLKNLFIVFRSSWGRATVSYRK
jgi:hypothetical protein